MLAVVPPLEDEPDDDDDDELPQAAAINESDAAATVTRKRFEKWPLVATAGTNRPRIHTPTDSSQTTSSKARFSEPTSRLSTQA